VLPGTGAAVDAGDPDALHGAGVHIGNLATYERRDQFAAVRGLVFGYGGEVVGSREHRRIVDAGDGDVRGSRRGAEGGGAAVGRGVHLGPNRTAALVPGLEGQRSRGAI